MNEVTQQNVVDLRVSFIIELIICKIIGWVQHLSFSYHALGEQGSV